jgi:hypothetical protein
MHAIIDKKTLSDQDASELQASRRGITDAVSGFVALDELHAGARAEAVFLGLGASRRG